MTGYCLLWLNAERHAGACAGVWRVRPLLLASLAFCALSAAAHPVGQAQGGGFGVATQSPAQYDVGALMLAQTKAGSKPLPPLAEPQSAGSFPSHPVRLVVPYAAGGGTDAVARILADALTARWGQQAIVDTRPGAGGTLGVPQVMQSAADGYTLLLSPLDLLISSVIYPKLAYDPLGDFVPIGPLVSSTLILVAHPGTGLHSLKQLVQQAQSTPGTLAFASCGNGTPQHLAGELFKMSAQIDLVHIPYKGCGPAQTDVLGGAVPLLFSAAANMAPYVRSGRLNALAVVSLHRSDALPEVPTFDESGYPGFVLGNWMALLAPARMPAERLGRLQADLEAVHRDAAFARRIVERGFEPMPGSAQAFRQTMTDDLRRVTDLVRQGRVHAD